MATFLPLSLLFLFLSSSTAAHHHHHHHHVPHPCDATRFPDVCVATLSKYHLRPDASAIDIIDAALNASATYLISSQSEVQAILDSSAGNVNLTNAARNCIDFLFYSARRLADADVFDLWNCRQWTSSALIYQSDCWSALKYFNDAPQVGEAVDHLLHLTNLTSNAVSLLGSYEQSDTWRPPQTERDGFWPPLNINTSRPFNTTYPPFPSPGDANATVCKAGGGCRYETVQAAVEAAPEYGKERYVVYIKEGVYEETVRVWFNKTNVVFIGDGIGRTVITGSLVTGLPGSSYNTATVVALGDGFMARNLTFQNTAGPEAHQAIAFRSDSDFSVFDTVEFAGHQDTLYPHSLRQYYHNCLISGTVDFIYGNAAAFFDNCTILVLPRQLNPEKGESNTITAHGRTDPAQPTGFVLNNCVINGSAEYLALYRNNSKVHKTYLGRPWREYSRTVVLRSWLSEIVRPEGWLAWDNESALSTLYYGELENTGPGATANRTAARVQWSSQVPADKVYTYSLEIFIQGDQFIPSGLVGSLGPIMRD